MRRQSRRWERRWGPLSTAALALGAFVVLATSPASASEWRTFGLQGVKVRSLDATADLLCAGTEGSGVYCRGLGAQAGGWTPIGPPGVTVTWVWIDPSEPLRRFAAAGIGSTAPSLFRTLNGGASWVPVDQFPNPGGPPPRAWTVHGAPGAVPLFAAGWSVWISHDLGATWQLSSSVGGEKCLEIAPTNVQAIWAGGESSAFMGFTLRSLDSGQSWVTVWDSHGIGDNQTADIAAHPTRNGLLLTGHEGFVLRSETDGASFTQVLSAGLRFFLDWDGGNPDRAYAAGSPNDGTAQAFLSCDRGWSWLDITDAALAPRTVFFVEGDETRVGVVYAATDNGVYRHYGGGAPVCLDARAGIDALQLIPGACPPTASQDGPRLADAPILGDAVAFDLGQVHAVDAEVDLGEVECLIDGGDLSLATLDAPTPAAGRALAILARLNGAQDYGLSSAGWPRRPALGDCRLTAAAEGPLADRGLADRPVEAAP